MTPPRIKIAVYFIFASLILTIIKNGLYLWLTEIQIWKDPLNIADLAYTAILGFLAVNILNHKNWARILYLILVLLGIFAAPIPVIRVLKNNPILPIVTMVIYICQWIALFMLFRKESNIWFNLKNLRL